MKLPNVDDLSISDDVDNVKQLVLKKLVEKIKFWRSHCFAYADMFPASVFSVREDSVSDPAAAAGVLARHVLTELGIELAARYEDLEIQLERASDDSK